MEDLKNHINTLKEKIQEVVKEIELEVENSKDKINNIKGITPQTLTSNLRNGDAYCSAMVSIMTYSDWYAEAYASVSPNYGEFYAVAIGRNYAMVAGESAVSCSCGDFIPLEEQHGEDLKRKYISEFNKEIEENEELKEIRESIKNKCQIIKGYVNEIIRITKEEEIKNIDDDNIKTIKSNGVTLVCIGHASAGGYGDKGTNSYSGIINNENSATSYSRANAFGNNVAIVYGYSYLDCKCKHCKHY